MRNLDAVALALTLLAPYGCGDDDAPPSDAGPPPTDAPMDAGLTDGARDQGADDTGPTDDATDDTGPSDAGTAPRVAFEVTGAYAYTDAPAGADLPASHVWSIRVQPTADGWTTFAGANGSVAESRFVPDDAGFSLTGEPLVVSPPRAPEGACQQLGSFRHDAITFAIADADEDGAPDTLTGEATGSVSWIEGDIAFEVPFVATLSGALDVRPPTLWIEGPTEDRVVVDPVRVTFSEPMPGPRTAVLEGGDGTGPMLLPSPLGAVIGGFESEPGLVLPLGAQLHLRVRALFSDLAGNEGLVDASLHTMADPGALEGDLESDPVAARIEGPATFGGTLGTLPAIGGARSLLLEPGGRFTVRVVVPAGGSTLRFRYRALSTGAPFAPFVEIVVAAPNGAFSTRAPALEEPASLEPTGDARWSAAGPVSDWSFELPAAGDESVLLDLRAPSTGCVGKPLPPTALWIDDIEID